MRTAILATFRGCGKINASRQASSVSGLSILQAHHQVTPQILAGRSFTNPIHNCVTSVRHVTNVTNPTYHYVPPQQDRPRDWSELNYEEMSALYDSGDILLIDVREPDEVERGKIPKSVNIPLGQLIKAFYGWTDEQWMEKFGTLKPKPEDANIVFYGQATWGMAIKSEAAVKIANRLGYMRVRHYIGGFKEWQEKEHHR